MVVAMSNYVISSTHA